MSLRLKAVAKLMVTYKKFYLVVFFSTIIFSFPSLMAKAFAIGTGSRMFESKQLDK